MRMRLHDRFLKIQQSNKISIFETVEFVRDSAHVNKRCLRKQTRSVFQPRYFSG